jgi:hypothetical protein
MSKNIQIPSGSEIIINGITQDSDEVNISLYRRFLQKRLIFIVKSK